MPKYISHKKVIFRVFNHDIFLCGNYDQQPHIYYSYDSMNIKCNIHGNIFVLLVYLIFVCTVNSFT